MAGRKGSIAAASNGWKFVLMLAMWLIARASLAGPANVYDIDLRTRSIAEALNRLSEQTGVPVVFPYDLVKDRKANPVVGRLTLAEALDELLKDTGLSGGLSDKGVVTVSPTKSGTSTGGETIVAHDENKQHTKKPRVDQRHAIATFFASIVAAFSASAEDAPDAGDDQAKMSYVVVTANKREERQQDVPVAMTVVDPNALAANGQNRLVDYFASVPGLNLSSNAFFGGTEYLTIRGLSAGSNQNPTVATVIDDVPVAGSTHLAYGNLTAPDLDPSDLARIEVLKGPQGTLYGADNLSGLIKYVTLDPSTSKFGGRAEIGSVDIPGGGVGYSARGAANIPVSDTVAVRVSGFSRRDPGYIDEVTTGQSNYNSTDAYGGHLAVLWRPSQSFSMKLSALYQDARGDSSVVDSNSLGQFTLGDLKATAIPGSTRYTAQNQLYSATIDAKVAGIDIVSVTGYVVNKVINWNDASGLTGPIANIYFPGTRGSAALFDATTDKISQELRVSSSIGHWLDWRLAGFYTHESGPGTVNNFYANNVATGAIVGDLWKISDTTLTFSERAVFGDLTAHVTDRLDVEFGGRESWNSQSFQTTDTGLALSIFDKVKTPVYLSPFQRATGDAFTYLATTRFTISPDLMTYARVASGYRIGGPNANAFTPTYQAFGMPTSFAPDRTTNYEVGVKGNLFDRMLRFDAAVYYIDWSQFQTPVSQTLVVQGVKLKAGWTTNAGNAKSEGVELSLEAHPTQRLTITAEGAYDNAVLTQNLPSGSSLYGLQGDRLPYSMRFSGGLSVNQDIALGQEWLGFVGGSVNYVGSRPWEFTTCCNASGQPNPRIEFPAYTQFNVRTGARSDSWLINLYINNVADKRGIVGLVASTAVSAPGGYYATVIQPRTVGLSVNKTF